MGRVFQQLIMQKAAEDLKKQQAIEAEEKKKIIDQRVPKLAIDGLDDGRQNQSKPIDVIDPCMPELIDQN